MEYKIYSKTTRAKVDKDIETEVSKIDGNQREILRQIFESLHEGDYNETARLQLTIARFATLLVSLSVQADRIQRRIAILTVFIAVLTFVLLGLTWLMLSKM